MKIGILTSHGEPAADQRFCEAATKRGHEAVLIDLMQCSLLLSQDANVHIYYHGRPLPDDIAAIIPRIDIPHTEFGSSVMRQFEALHFPTTDSVAAIEHGRDKLQCMQRLSEYAIPMPATGFAYTREDLKKIIGTVGDYPIIMKLIEGTEGNGVFRVHSLDEAYDIFDRHNTQGMRLIVQEYISESAGTDIRSFVIDGKIVASMRRQSQNGDFRANVSLGAHSFPVDLTTEEAKMVLAATNAIDIQIAGVDFVRSNRGPLLLEINTSPGFTGEQGLESVTSVDVAGLMIDFAVHCAMRQTQPSLITTTQAPLMRGLTLSQ